MAHTITGPGYIGPDYDYTPPGPPPVTGTFVAVSVSSNIAATSLDGVTWTARTVFPSASGLHSVAANNGTFVTVSQTINGTIYYSSNQGVNWAPVSAAPIGYGVAYGGGKFVAISSLSKNVTVSSNGAPNTWTNYSNVTFSNALAITYGSGKFVVVGANANAAYSSDGVNWNLTPIANLANVGYQSVAYGGGQFVAVGGGTQSISTDGITWANVTGVTGSSIAYGAGKFVVLGISSNHIWYSSDAVSWQTTTVPINLGSYPWICYGNNTFVAVQFNGANSLTSTDGVNWTLSNTLPGNSQWRSVTYG